MFGRYFLVLLSLISLSWIVFVGYDLLDRRDRISPNHIFTVKDGEILIINRSDEVQTDELDFKVNTRIEPVFENLMKHVFQNERIYVSQKRPLIIVELARIWNADLVSDYLMTKHLEHYFSKNGEIVVLKKFQVRFKKNHLLISTDTKVEAHGEEAWPLWDGKASASIIHLKKPLKSTNIYFREDGTVSYQTKYGPLLHCRKIDDYDYFAQFLPAKIENYHFFEKEFARKTGILPSNSPLYQWMEDGMVQFQYEGASCILSDYNKSIDPMQMLLSDSDESEDMMGNHFKNIPLTRDFPRKPGNGFYIGKVGDKVLVSDKKEALERIMADYQLGNTLALSAEKTQEVYGKMPKKVSERLALSDDFYTLSSYKNLLIRTGLYTYEGNGALAETDGKPEEKPQDENSSFSVSQETAYLLGNGNIVFAVGKQNEIIALSNKKQMWKVNLEGTITGRVKLIDINENGKQQLLVATTNKVYVINTQNGGNVNEFPVALNCQSAVSSYRWNGKTNFLAVNTNNELVHIDENGRVLKRLKVNASQVQDEVDVYKNGKTLTAVLTGKNKIQYVDLERNRNGKNGAFIPQNHFQLKSDNGYLYFTQEDNSLNKYTLQGQKTVLASGNKLKVKKIYRGKEQLIAYCDGQQIVLLDKLGNAIQRIPVKIGDAEDFDVITTRSGATYAAVLEGIENNIYILDSNGQKVTGKSFEGKGTVKLSEEQGQLVITSTLDRNIIQHYGVMD
ncbi:MAG: hypothetical protein ACO1O6_09625 [Bacteroidota bacterium]